MRNYLVKIISRQWFNTLSECLYIQSDWKQIKYFQYFIKQLLNTKMEEARFSKITYNVLKKAGWFPRRRVFSTIHLPSGFNLLGPARDVLDEFGGLSLLFYYSEKRGRRTHLGETEIILDPIRCGGQSDSIAEESRLIGHPLYPLGEVFDEYYDPDESTILIDDLGRVFLVSFFATYFMGETFDISLDHMITGIKGKMVDQNGLW